MISNNIIIADDHKIFREGLKSLIETEGLGVVVAEASNGEKLLELLKKDLPDLIIMDIAMPKLNGIETTKQVLELYPTLKILALTASNDEEYFLIMKNAGVHGYILKSSGLDELEFAIKTINANKTYFSNELLLRVIKTAQTQNVTIKLTPREKDVLKLICEGLTNEKIAIKLTLSIETIKGYRSQLLAKTNSTNTASLVMYAIRNKIVRILN